MLVISNIKISFNSFTRWFCVLVGMFTCSNVTADFMTADYQMRTREKRNQHTTKFILRYDLGLLQSTKTTCRTLTHLKTNWFDIKGFYNLTRQLVRLTPEY